MTGDLSRRRDGVVPRPGQVSGWSTPARHTAGELDFRPARSREECWADLSPAVVGRIAELSGSTFEWWACDVEDGVSAVVTGDRGLALAHPVLNGSGHAAHEVRAFCLDPASWRSTQVRESERAAPRARGPFGPAGPPGPSPTGWPTGLDAADRGLLGHLPSQAQDLLQAPFLAGDEVLRCLWSASGDDANIEAVTVVLAGRRSLTLAHGTRNRPVGGGAHVWHLVCRRADVVRRIGR